MVILLMYCWFEILFLTLRMSKNMSRNQLAGISGVVLHVITPDMDSSTNMATFC